MVEIHDKHWNSVGAQMSRISARAFITGNLSLWRYIIYQPVPSLAVGVQSEKRASRMRMEERVNNSGRKKKLLANNCFTSSDALS